jgi:hypothetical protein
VHAHFLSLSYAAPLLPPLWPAPPPPPTGPLHSAAAPSTSTRRRLLRPCDGLHGRSEGPTSGSPAPAAMAYPNGASPGCSERSSNPGGGSRERDEQSLAPVAAHRGAVSGGPAPTTLLNTSRFGKAPTTVSMDPLAAAAAWI